MRKMIPALAVLTAGLTIGLALPNGPAVAERKPVVDMTIPTAPEVEAEVQSIADQYAADMTEAGFIPTGDVTGPDGKRHDDCWIFVGDTSLLECRDGFSEES